MNNMKGVFIMLLLQVALVGLVFSQNLEVKKINQVLKIRQDS